MRPFHKGWQMAYSLDQIKDFAANPSSVPAPGSYGEGQVYNIAEMLRNLKSEISKGTLTVNDYFNVAEPLIKQAQNTTMAIGGGGSKKANSVNPAWQQIQTLGAVKAVNGQWQAILPFSSREYASLPENVLPTQQEVNSGVVPLDLLPPVQRFRPEPTPQQNPGTTVPGQGTPTTTQIPDPANPGKFINVPVVDDPLRNSVPKTVDQSIIEQEAARQAEQSRQAYEAEKSIRGQRLTDLSDLLTKQENQKFSLEQPGIYEDLNSRGLLRSSGLGEALAKEKSKLAGESANTLLQQGLTDRDADIQGIQDILARTQQFQSSGLERKFTLEDFQREADLSKSLGAGYAPTVKGGNSVLSGVLGGATTGATAGGAIGGPWGAGIGAILTGTAAGLSANKGK